MREVEVRVLGPVELRVDGLQAPVERVQVRRMLALVALHAGGPIAADRLVEELWPGELPKSPRAALRVVASRLRAALGGHADALRSNAHEYVLDIDRDAVDALSFERLLATDDRPASATELDRLDSAVRLWRGDPFGGAHGPPSLDAAASRLEELHLDAAVRRAELLLAAGAANRAVTGVTALVNEDTIDERVWAVHAIALARAGRRSEAIDSLRRARRVLRDRHGLTPTDVLVAAERTVLSATYVAAAGPAAPRAPVVVGRDVETSAALQWLTRSATVPPCVLLVGAAGVGKTTLADTVAAGLGRPLVRARCDPDLADLEGLEALLGSDAPSALTGGAHSRSVDRADALVADLEARAATEPLLLVLDDVHLAGELELHVLLRLVRTTTAATIGIVATMRPTDAAVDARIQRLIDKVGERDNVCRIEVGGLDRDASRRAYAAWTPATPGPVDAGLLMELTAGNPYLIRSLAEAGLDLADVRSVAARRLLGDVTAARLAALGADDATILRAAAILGRTIDLALLAAAAGPDERTVAAAIDRGVAAQLLVTQGPVIAFDHELTRLGLAADVGPAAAAVLHAAATDAARALGRGPAIVARHIIGAGELRTDRRAIADLLDGADHAATGGAFDDAVRFLAAAADLEPDRSRRSDIRREQAWALECAGRAARADELYDEILDVARQDGDTTAFGRAALGGAAFGGVMGGSPRRLERLLDAIADPPPDERLHLEIVIAAITELESADRPVPPELDALVEQLASDGEAGVLGGLVGLRRRVRGPADPGLVGEVTDHGRAVRRTGDIALVLDAAEMLGRVNLGCGDLAATDRAVEELHRLVRRHIWPRYVWTAALFDAVLTDLRDGPDRADALARRAMSIGREHGVPDAGNAYSMFRLSVAQREGTLGEIVPFVELAVHAPGAPPAWHGVLAATQAAAGDISGATASLTRFWAGMAAGSQTFAHVGWAFAARAGARIGDAASVRACIGRLLPWSGGLLVVGAGGACFGATDTVLAAAMHAVDDPRADEFAARGAALLSAARATTWA